MRALGRSRRLATALTFCFVAGVVVARGQSGLAEPSTTSPPLPPEPVRLSYEAPSTCPGAEVFLSQVRARVGPGWEAPPGVLARTIEVRVASDGAHSAASIDYVDDNGKHVTRTVAAVTCDEVVSGIALVTALAIEARVPKAGAPGTSGTVLPAPVLPALPSPVLVPLATPPAPPSGPPPPHVDVGSGLLAVLGGAGPGTGLGPRAFVGLGWEEGPDLRLGVDLAESLSSYTDSLGRRALNRFALYGVRASACPWAWGGAVRVLPCAGAEVGVVHAASFDLARVDRDSANPAFFTPFASIRADAALDPSFFVEIEAEARFPIGGRQFVYSGASGTPDSSVYTVPWAAFGASAAFGLRL